MVELNGDDKLSYKEKIHYLFYNLKRNLIGEKKVLIMPYFFNNNVLVSDIASPGRTLSDEFIAFKLPQLLDKSVEKVIDVGCGSGRSAELLKNVQSITKYTGIDTIDRFNYSKNTSFEKYFTLIDIKNYISEDKFDLVMSVSALEHIKSDDDIIKNLLKITRKGGFQVHVVPAGAALFAYLWHGYRQYTLKSITQKFNTSKLVLFELGGIGSLLVHIFWITIPENLLKFNARLRFKKIYKVHRATGFWLDRVLPFWPLLYVVFLKNEGI